MKLHITQHAVERASERLWKHYRATREQGEGIVTWLTRVAESALTLDGPWEQTANGFVIKTAGMELVFQYGGDAILSLVTCMNDESIPRKLAVKLIRELLTEGVVA